MMSYSHFCAIDLHFSIGTGKKSLLSTENIVMGRKGMLEVCHTCAARGQQEGSADAAALPTWGPGITEGSNRL